MRGKEKAETREEKSFDDKGHDLKYDERFSHLLEGLELPCCLFTLHQGCQTNLKPSFTRTF